MAFILSRFNPFLATTDVKLDSIIGNTELFSYAALAAKELGIIDPRSHEDLFKKTFEFRIETSKLFLSGSIANAFLNAGSSRDLIFALDPSSEAFDRVKLDSWVLKHRDSGITSAVASIGLICLYNVDFALFILEPLTHSDNAFVRAGALLGIGIASANVRHCADATWALLREFLEDHSSQNPGLLSSCALIGYFLQYYFFLVWL